MEAVHYFLNHYGCLGIFLLLALGVFGPPVADFRVILLRKVGVDRVSS